MSLEHAFFYKSVNGDRVYDDTSFEHWLKKFFTSGVFLNDLQVTANDDMTVTVGAGYANIEGKVKIFESTSSLIIETAGASYPRIDSIVLERNDTERDILLKVVKGGYSSEPVPHTPVRQDGVYQLVIAQVLVNAGAVKVTQANITDTRSNTDLCGIVAGAVEQIDFSQVQAQFDAYFAQYKKQIATDYAQYNDSMEEYLDQLEADFAAWFEGIRNQLDEDAAGHLQNQIDDINARLEYAGGSIVEITVDAVEFNVEGLEVNLVIDGKTYTETINDNTAKFTGILEVGTAKITCVDEAQEFNAEKNIEIPYYGAYKCLLGNGGGGSYEKWIEAGGLNPSSYESLESLLEDEKAIRTLMTKKAAVDVLAKMSGDDLATIINHPYIAKWVNYREYAYSTLSAVSEIKTIMDASGMYGMYITVESDGTWQPKGLVPVMTSNTAPYGEASASSTHASGNYPVWKAFDGSTNEAHTWITVGSTNEWIQYKFNAPTIVRRFMIWNTVNTGQGNNLPKNLILQASNDGSKFDNLGSFVNTKNYGVNNYFDVNNSNSYLYYRLLVVDNYGGSSYIRVDEMQFYGRQLESLIPPMTSNTAPMGKVSASREKTSGSAYYVFDGQITNAYNWSTEGSSDKQWIQYEFEKPQVVTAICVNNNSMTSTSLFSDYEGILKGSVDGDKWDDLTEIIVKKTSTSYIGFVEFENTTAYKYYRLLSTKNNVNYGGHNYVQIDEISLYGTPDYESRTYIYEHGVEVMEVGVADCSATHGTLTKENDYLSMEATNTNTSSGNVFPTFYTTNPIDFTAFKTINVKIGKIAVKHSNGLHHGIMRILPKVPSKNGDSNTAVCNIANLATVLDISNVNATEYADFLVHGGGEKITISEWWMK